MGPPAASRRAGSRTPAHGTTHRVTAMVNGRTRPSLVASRPRSPRSTHKLVGNSRDRQPRASPVPGCRQDPACPVRRSAPDPRCRANAAPMPRHPLSTRLRTDAHALTWACERAGDGNRTRTTSLEGWGSTVELHPRGQGSLPTRGAVSTDVYLEIAPKRTFACAVDWPGWCRSGRGRGGGARAPRRLRRALRTGRRPGRAEVPHDRHQT